jgi:transcriptional regulator with XRE-family HTH domain
VAFEPIRIPDEVLIERVQVLQDRDAGALLGLARRHCGATQHRLAAATGLTQGRISGLLRGSGGPVTSLEVWERIAEGLNLPDTARYVLGLAPEQARVTSTSLPGWRPRAPVTSPFVRRGVGQRRWMDVPWRAPDVARSGGRFVLVSLPQGGVVVQIPRRALLTALGVGGTAGTLTDLHEATASVPADAELLAVLGDGLRKFQAAGRVTPPSELVDPLTGQVALLEVVRRRAPDGLRRGYLRLQAEYAETLSWMVQEAGDPSRALYWVDRAQHWAGLGRWSEMTAYSHVRRSQLASRYSGDGPAAIEYAALAFQMAAAPAQIRGLAAKQMAYGYALASQPDNCRRALDQAADLFGAKASEDQTEGPIVGLRGADDPGLLPLFRATCDIYLGGGEQAIALMDSSRAAPGSDSRLRAISGARLTRAYAQVGDPQRACVLALEAVNAEALVGSLATRIELRRALPPLARWPDRADVNEVRQRVTTLA